MWVLFDHGDNLTAIPVEIEIDYGQYTNPFDVRPSKDLILNANLRPEQHRDNHIPENVLYYIII
jgi:hypothetical protein